MNTRRLLPTARQCLTPCTGSVVPARVPLALACLMVLLLASFSLTPVAGARMAPLPIGPSLVPWPFILIRSDSQFTSANGVSKGNGTEANPYIISDLEFNVTRASTWANPQGIWIEHTRAHFVIRNTYIHSVSAGYGNIYLSDAPNGTIEDIVFERSNLGIEASSNTRVFNVTFSAGVISVSDSADVSISRASLSSELGNWWLTPAEISIWNATRVAVTDSSVSSVGSCEICLWSTTSATLARNRLAIDGISIRGDRLEHFASHTITPDNVVNGAPVLYVRDRTGVYVVGGTYGQVIVANSSSVRLWGLGFQNTSIPVEVAYSRIVSIAGNQIDDTPTHELRDLRYTGSFPGEISVFFSQHVAVAYNEVRSHDVAISFDHAADVVATGNALSAVDATALVFQYSENASATYNDVTDTWKPVWVLEARNVTIYRNNFDEFEVSPTVLSSVNVSFDHGYPDGGNYWFDYRGMDNCAGPAQWDCEQSDGIGDVWYILNGTLEDRYPLMRPSTLPDAGSGSGGGSILDLWVPLLVIAVALVFAAVVARRRRRIR